MIETHSSCRMRIPCQSIASVSLCFSILWVFSVCFFQHNLWASHVPFRLEAVLAMGDLFTPYWSVQIVGFPTIHCRVMLQRIQKSRKNKYAVLVLIKTQLAAALLNKKEQSVCAMRLHCEFTRNVMSYRVPGSVYQTSHYKPCHKLQGSNSIQKTGNNGLRGFPNLCSPLIIYTAQCKNGLCSSWKKKLLKITPCSVMT